MLARWRERSVSHTLYKIGVGLSDAMPPKVRCLSSPSAGADVSHLQLVAGSINDGVQQIAKHLGPQIVLEIEPVDG